MTNFTDMKRIHVILISIISALNGHAQMTLNDCLIYARDHAHSNRIYRLEEKTAAADRRIAVADMLPHVSFSSSGSLSFGRNIDPETNTYDNKRTLGTGFGVNLSLPLFDGLIRMNNLKALRTSELRRKQKRLIEEDRVSLEVIRSFYNVYYCRSLVEQMDRQLRRDSTDLVATEMREALGTKSGADVAEMKAIVASDVCELLNQKNLLKKAYLTLRCAMGMQPSDEPLHITDSTYNHSVITSLRSLPVIEDAKLAVKECRHYLNSARGGYSPNIYFSAGISTSYYRLMGIGVEVPSFSRQFRDNMGEYFGFSLSIPLFDGLATATRVKRAKINLMESGIQLEQTRDLILQATEEARLDSIAAIEELAAAQQRLEAEETAYKAMRRKFELGTVSAIDLFTSASRLANAEANLTGKHIQYLLAGITLRYYQGYPLIDEL